MQSGTATVGRRPVPLRRRRVDWILIAFFAVNLFFILPAAWVQSSVGTRTRTRSAPRSRAGRIRSGSSPKARNGACFAWGPVSCRRPAARQSALPGGEVQLPSCRSRRGKLISLNFRRRGAADRRPGKGGCLIVRACVCNGAVYTCSPRVRHGVALRCRTNMCVFAAVTVDGVSYSYLLAISSARCGRALGGGAGRCWKRGGGMCARHIEFLVRPEAT
jgi:hypothetical protein